MKLSDYIADKGDRAFADQIGAARRTVTDWRLGQRIPRPEWAQIIVAKTGGKVSMNDIYGAERAK